MLSDPSIINGQHNPNHMTTSLFNTSGRHRPFGAQNTSSSFHQNLNQIPTTADNNYLMETRAFPYERLNQTNSGTESGNHINHNNIHTFRANSNCKIYQDLDEFKGHLV